MRVCGTPYRFDVTAEGHIAGDIPSQNHIQTPPKHSHIPPAHPMKQRTMTKSGFHRTRSRFVTASILTMTVFLSGCGTSMIAGGGPTAGQIVGKAFKPSSGLTIVELNADITQRVLAAQHQVSFSESLGRAEPVPDLINRGDVIDLTIWEAPPAVLFGATAAGVYGSAPSSVASSQPARLPAQTVDSNGRLQVPFIGYVQAAGRSPQAVGNEIRERLIGRANAPQVLVSIAHNTNQTVTVVGDVGQSGRIPLTSRGERLLDILASAGGVRQPVNKMTIRVTRGGIVRTMPLDSILQDSRQNVVLKPDDVVTAFYQPYSFTVLGAAGLNNEINFEGTGITLAQAMGRMGGLQDARADVKGVFIFRMERSEVFESSGGQKTAPRFVPVIYRVNMTDPGTFFIAQKFPIKDKDVIYISNATAADLMKFVGIVSNVVLPIASAQVLLNNNN